MNKILQRNVEHLFSVIKVTVRESLQQNKHRQNKPNSFPIHIKIVFLRHVISIQSFLLVPKIQNKTWYCTLYSSTLVAQFSLRIVKERNSDILQLQNSNVNN